MQKSARNIYQTARVSAGFTQEYAAELLNVSVGSLGDYEGGRRPPPGELVAVMVDVYRTPFLAVQHLRQSPLTEGILPDVDEQSLPQAVLQLIAQINGFAERHRADTLINIASDGVIDERERPVFDQTVEELQGIIKAALSVKFAKG